MVFYGTFVPMNVTSFNSVLSFCLQTTFLYVTVLKACSTAIKKSVILTFMQAIWLKFQTFLKTIFKNGKSKYTLKFVCVMYLTRMLNFPSWLKQNKSYLSSQTVPCKSKAHTSVKKSVNIFRKWFRILIFGDFSCYRRSILMFIYLGCYCSKTRPIPLPTSAIYENAATLFRCEMASIAKVVGG